MKNKLVLESMSMDLKRVALGCQRNSLNMAKRFYEEALKRKKELDMSEIRPYLQKVLAKIEKFEISNPEKAGEDALMMSTLLQNYSQTFLRD